MTTEVQRLSAQRDKIYDWACDRFEQLIVEERNDDALAFADEFFEWLDPEQADEEPIHYYDERELEQLYEQSHW